MTTPDTAPLLLVLLCAAVLVIVGATAILEWAQRRWPVVDRGIDRIIERIVR